MNAETGITTAAENASPADPFDLRRRLLEALNTPGEDPALEAEAVHRTPESAGCILCSTAFGETRLSPVMIDGLAVAPLTADAGEGLQIADMLDRLDPLISRLEQLCGAAFEPVGVGDGDAEGLVIRIQTRDESGSLQHRLDWRPPSGLNPQTILAQGGAAPAILASAGVSCAVSTAAPDLDDERLAALEPGDILLVPALSSPGGLAAIHAPDPVGTVFGCRLNAGEDAKEAGETPAPAWEELAPPLTVRIDSVSLPVSLVSALKPGSPAPLRLDREPRKARLLKGETVIASGVLVPIGTAYGLLIEETAAGGAL